MQRVKFLQKIMTFWNRLEKLSPKCTYNGKNNTSLKGGGKNPFQSTAIKMAISDYSKIYQSGVDVAGWSQVGS